MSSNGHFVTLTYNTEKVPITENRYLTLSKKDCQDFFKRLRHDEPNIKYYLVGEYGTKKGRPHYHIILFNCNNIENVHKHWKLGDVHHGTVTQQSIAYTLEYITTKSAIDKNHKRDDRQKEFTLISKGIGKSYITEKTIKYHKDNKTKMYINIEDGYKIPMPKYYRNKIFNEQEKEDQAHYIQKVLKEEYEYKLKKYGLETLERQKMARSQKLVNKLNKAKKDI